MKRLTASMAILSIFFFIGSVAAADKPMVKVSGQPCLYGMPAWEIMEQKPANLPIEMKYSMFPSGAPRSRPWPPAREMSAPSGPYLSL